MFEAKERMLTLTFMASIGKAVVASRIFPVENCLIQVPCGALHSRSSEFIFEVKLILESEKVKLGQIKKWGGGSKRGLSEIKNFV
mgnify:CR=1 FL=1